jgi:hypothetical protein
LAASRRVTTSSMKPYSAPYSLASIAELVQRRHDAESINRHLDDTLWLRQANSIGARRQLLNLIPYAIGVNAMSVHVHRQGLAPPVAA